MDNLNDLRKKIESRFRSYGIEDAGIEATQILEHHAGVRRHEFPYIGVSQIDQNGLETMICRRCCREPLAYIEEVKEFYGLTLSVSPAVLIPRPETELLVETALEALKGRPEPWVLDIGTGSGAIAAAIAANNSSAKILASDISEAALAIAAMNIDQCGFHRRIRLINMDLISALIPTQRFDLIVSNPPYVPDGDIDGLAPELGFEPRRALKGGPSGIDFYHRILADTHGLLRDDGLLAMEIGWGQADLLRGFIANQGIWRIESILPDYSGIERIIVCSRSQKGSG